MQIQKIKNFQQNFKGNGTENRKKFDLKKYFTPEMGTTPNGNQYHKNMTMPPLMAASGAISACMLSFPLLKSAVNNLKNADATQVKGLKNVFRQTGKIGGLIGASLFTVVSVIALTRAGLAAGKGVAEMLNEDRAKYTDKHALIKAKAEKQ